MGDHSAGGSDGPNVVLSAPAPSLSRMGQLSPDSVGKLRQETELRMPQAAGVILDSLEHHFLEINSNSFLMEFKIEY